jgi:SAM-dependent methyltransferase
MASAEHIRYARYERPDVRPRISRIGKLATPTCPLCGSRETAQAFKENGCSLRNCANCELFFVHPYPEQARQHEVVSSGASTEIEILDCERRYKGEQLYYERHLGSIVEECRNASSMLDVGCGTGCLLENLKSHSGFYTAGIELNTQAAQFARRLSGRPIYEVPFEEFRSDRKFDVITLINVLSHVPSFYGLFRSLRAALRPGGKVILRTSEMSGNVRRWNQVHWGIPDDLHFLGLGTLDFLCKKYGFAVTRHIRTPFEDELFLPSRWQQKGRNRIHNVIKSAGVRTPMALPALKKLYSAALGQRLYISFIVLTALQKEIARPPECDQQASAVRRVAGSH